MLETILTVISLVFGVTLIVAILLQQRGAGMGGAIGGAGGGTITTSKRGAEKWLYNGTIALAVLFIGVNAALMILA